MNQKNIEIESINSFMDYDDNYSESNGYNDAISQVTEAFEQVQQEYYRAGYRYATKNQEKALTKTEVDKIFEECRHETEVEKIIKRWYVRYSYVDYEGDTFTDTKIVEQEGELFNFERFETSVQKYNVHIVGLWEIAKNDNSN